MKSQTLSQFQSVMQELDTFARKAGSKDKVKRKSRGLSSLIARKATPEEQSGSKKILANAGKGAAVALGALALAKRKNIGGYAKGIGMVGKNAVKQGTKKAANQAYKAGEAVGKAANAAKQTAMNLSAKGERIVNKRKASRKVAGLLPGISNTPKTINIK